MKLIQVSDLHLVAPGERLFGLDPLGHLEDCIADINRSHADADLVIFSGDLTDSGDPSAYAAFAERLPSLVPPFRLMMGNHDDRDLFSAAFPDVPMEGGFLQSAVDLPGGRVVLADTLHPGHVEGRLCEVRLQWIDAALEGAEHAFLFMHHPPCPIGAPALDDSRLADADALRMVLDRHGNVRSVFSGHVHRFSSGLWLGMPFATARGTNHQSALQLTGPYSVSFEAPSYSIILADKDRLNVHLHEFACRPAGA